VAEELSAKGAPVKIRSPWAPVLLGIVTLGIYHFVWYYLINAEMKAYGDRTGDAELQTINPVRALLALFPGIFLLGIPTLISYINCAKHIERSREISGVRPESTAYLWFVLVPYVGSYIVVYMVQQRLNSAWQAAAGGGAGVLGAPPQPTAPLQSQPLPPQPQAPPQPPPSSQPPSSQPQP
jgi:hypothetical protein